MKKLIISIILGIIIFGLGCATGYDWRKYDQAYGGYTAIYFANTKSGWVYENQGQTSAIAVIYPEWNSVYLYSVTGQDIFTFAQFDELYTMLNRRNIITSSQPIIAEIIPYTPKS